MQKMENPIDDEQRKGKSNNRRVSIEQYEWKKSETKNSSYMYLTLSN